MQRFDLIIRNGKAILPAQGEQAVDIAIGNDKIAALLAPGTVADAATTLDAKGLIVMPGAIDAHLHLGHGEDIARPACQRMPRKRPQRQLSAASRAIIPYLIASEPYETIFDEVRNVTEAGARIDFGYHLIISTEEQLAGVRATSASSAAPTFKIFMNNRGGDGHTARFARYRRWLSAASLRSRGSRVAAWCVRIPKRSSWLGCCATAARR